MKILDEIAKGESKTLELKRELPENIKIAKTAVAFSNTSGGKIVIGVDNDLNIVGLNCELDIFALKDTITNIVNDSCKPDIFPEIYTKNVEDRVLLVIEVHRGNLTPYYLKRMGKEKGTIVRIGATNKKAGPERIQELERQKINKSYDEDINYLVQLDEIDIEPIKEKFAAVGKKIDEAKMKSLGLIVEKEGNTYPSNGLLVLLGYFEHCMTMCSRFRGNTMIEFLDRKEYGGDLFSQLENTEIFIKNHIRLETEISGLQRKEKYEIPEVAIRESLVNALVHRDYSNPGRNIKVAVYDGSVNIVSPGGLPNTITQQDIFDGRSEIRNRVIAKVFKELGYIEMWGSGINRIVESCEGQNLKTPVIEEKNDFFNVRLFKEVVSKDERVKTVKSNPQYNIIINYMINHNNIITTKEAAIKLGVSDRRARRILNEMIDNEMVIRVGEGPATRYTLGQQVPDSSG